jgi:hypothetical protein
MTKDDAVRFFGSHEKIAEIIGTTRQSVGKREFFMPLAQLKLFIASGGQLALDESLATLIADVVKVMFWEDVK